jgi:5-methylthioadenosine/S-adenosylhomocysteine deaminase
MASNNRMDLLEEARAAVLMQRVRARRSDSLPAAQALALATLGGARALGLADRVGSLEVGKDADLAAFPLGAGAGVPLHDPVAATVFALGGSAATLVVVAGRVLVRDARLVEEDTGLATRVQAAADALRAWRLSPGV